jgi:hypothetical protein
MTSVEASLKRDLGAVRFAWWQAWTLLELAILQGGRFPRQVGMAALRVGACCRICL